MMFVHYSFINHLIRYRTLSTEQMLIKPHLNVYLISEIDSVEYCSGQNRPYFKWQPQNNNFITSVVNIISINLKAHF